MLGMLLALTLVAIALALVHVAPLWVAIPPVFMLAGFLVLLREAALTDAQREFAGLDAQADSSVAEGHAHGRREAGVAGSGSAEAPSDSALWESAETDDYGGATAQVIDISGRIHDQLYDQYTDAAERAVGD
jgi:hypothetical protein